MIYLNRWWYGTWTLEIKNLTVLVLGLGGVGSYAVESIVRSGIKKIILVDNDIIDKTNLNRQLISLNSNIGKYKTDEFSKRIKDINPNVEIRIITEFITKQNVNILFEDNIDYIVDACDTIETKKELIKECVVRNIKFISCMGTGNKFDPSRLKIMDIRKTSYDPLAKIIRKMVKDENIKQKIYVVCSDEKPIKISGKIGSNSFVPATAGLLCTSYIINDAIKWDDIVKKELIKIIKCLSGNVLLIGIENQDIYDEINCNENITNCNALTKYKRRKIKLWNSKAKETSKFKNIKIKKLRKVFKKKKVDFIICNIDDIKQYLKSFVSNSVYINSNMLYIYGTDYDFEDVISKYKRYNVIIKKEKYEDGYILFIDNKNSKNNFFLDIIYYFIDTLNNLRNIIADILVGWWNEKKRFYFNRNDMCNSFPIYNHYIVNYFNS